MARNIEETRATCGSCSHVWHYGKREEQEAKAAAMENLGKDLMCCGGCLPAALIKDQPLVDLNRCPQCGSRDLTRERIVHEVDD